MGDAVTFDLDALDLAGNLGQRLGTGAESLEKKAGSFYAVFDVGFKQVEEFLFAGK